MERDLRPTSGYREAEALYRALWRPGTGEISDAADISVAPDGSQVVFAGTKVDALTGIPPTCLCRVSLDTGAMELLTRGSNTDRLPKYSPDGRRIAFLSDRHAAGDFQLYLLDPVDASVRAAPRVNGWVEYLHWSPDGRRILLGVAGHGADLSSGQGATTSKQVQQDLPSWLPVIDGGTEPCRWRQVWVYELADDVACPVAHAGLNVWESAWCGDHSIATVASPGPSEGLWYSARLFSIDLRTGRRRELFGPHDQLGWPAADPTGRHLAIVEAVCSDRWSVAGNLRLIDTTSGEVRSVDTRGVDVTFTEWRSERTLLLGGHRGFETVLLLYDVAEERIRELWCDSLTTTPPRYIQVSGFNEDGDCALIGESYLRAPEIAVIRAGRYRAVKSLGMGYDDHAQVIGSIEPVRWRAPDDLEIQGWLLRPRAAGPHPLVMNIHGGPVSHWRPTWLGRPRVAPMLMLLKRGYAVFFPNPRGSSGRGQEFAREVLGGMCDVETQDFLSGLDHLVARGIADPRRLGVMGGSYGGLMTCWLITQDQRFAAAVAVAPITNHVTEQLLSNIPHFTALFLHDSYENSGGRHFSRSPIMYASRVRTPTLNICGALDRCTPPEEAVQFHNALRAHGIASMLVNYPEEGHEIRKLPATLDFAARVLDWFEKHMPGSQHTKSRG